MKVLTNEELTSVCGGSTLCITKAYKLFIKLYKFIYTHRKQLVR